MKELLLKIISGGQTGADTGGLIAAQKAGIRTGGCAPKGFITEDGSNPELGSVYGLYESNSDQYPTAGNIIVDGNAGLYAGAEMKKGYLEINGNTGDFLGGALPGNKMGMKGGLILVKGNAGDRVGDHLRRGMILIEGNTGDYCGSRMIAGTIAVMGTTGRHVGYAMRRGTLLLWNTPYISASFNDCGTHTLAFLPIMFKAFATLNSRFAEPATAFNRVQRYAGDMAEMGRGEILVKH